MKTTIELPEPLLRQARILAARRGTTLRELVADGLRRVVEHPDPMVTSARALQPDEEEVATLGAHGLPVLRRRSRPKRVVTGRVIDRIRDELSL